MREKEPSPARERRVNELQVASPSTSTSIERAVSVKSYKSAEPSKEPTKGRKVATASNNVEVPSPTSRKRKSVGGDGDSVIEQPKPATKRGRKKATEIEKAYIVPVTDYSKCEYSTYIGSELESAKENLTFIRCSDHRDIANRSNFKS